MMLVGEQPGDHEDRAGRPFVGPAGRLLDEALAEAGIDRDAVYVTNAVKHFKWKARGKRRIHQKPTWGEVDGVPALAGRRAGGGAARRARAARRDRRPDAARPQLPRDAEPWRGDRGHRPRTRRRRNAASVGRAPRAGRRGAPALHASCSSPTCASPRRCCDPRVSTSETRDALVVIDVIDLFEHADADALLASYRARLDGLRAALAEGARSERSGDLRERQPRPLGRRPARARRRGLRGDPAARW